MALLASIGSSSKAFARLDLTERLNDFTKLEKIWHPVEGMYSVLSKRAIFETLCLLNKSEVVVMDEFEQVRSTLHLNKINAVEFSEKISDTDYYIYSMDSEIIFAIDWDSFFFLIATDKKKMDTIISSKLFSGFLCDDETELDWGSKE